MNDRSAAETRETASTATSATAGGGWGATRGAEECREPRRVADERCTVASRAREQADAARDALRLAQRTYDEHQARIDEAERVADPRAVRGAKDAAQRAFRASRSSAATREEIEAAARDWLTEINRINRGLRDAAETVTREREAAAGILPTIERLTVEADAARIASEAADAACVAAREALADCEEAAGRRASDVERAAAVGGAGTTTTAAASPRSGWPPSPSFGPGAGRFGDETDDASELEAAFTATGVGEPAVLRLLRGDRSALAALVAELAGEDASERRRWQLALADLIDAVVVRAIEAASLVFPLEHPFWGAFTVDQNRDIARALASLGFRFDGMGGWVDDRVPTQRDLALAVGYAGLDPMRIRPWPKDAELRELFADVAVAADEYVTKVAGGLTLGELVSVLGGRADALTDVWNEWGRLRPLLLRGA